MYLCFSFRKNEYKLYYEKVEEETLNKTEAFIASEIQSIPHKKGIHN